MREFVRGESFVLTACGYASARVEDDVIAGGDGLRINRIDRTGRKAIGMNAHPPEVGPQARFHQ